MTAILANRASHSVALQMVLLTVIACVSMGVIKHGLDLDSQLCGHCRGDL